jgi:hypothetical protein
MRSLASSKVSALALLVALGCASEAPPTKRPPPPEEEEKLDAAKPMTVPKDAGAPDKAPAVSPDMGKSPDLEGGEQTDVGGTAGTLIDNPTGPMPMDLKDVGIFTAIPDLTKVHAKAFAFSPRYPLWSNGLDKVRYAVLPDKTTIDTTARDAWSFPVGTLFFKTFSYKDATGKAIPVETRVIRRISTTGEVYKQWQFHVYEWNAAGTSATLATLLVDPDDPKNTNSPLKRIPRMVSQDGQMFTHNIPKVSDCWNCHIANKATIIGFDELRLNSKLGAATTTQLEQVAAKGWLSKPPVAPLIEVTGRNPAEKAALEYLQANCAHCHNGEEAQEPGARYKALDLRYQNAVKQTVNVETMTVGTAAGIRIVPGMPAKSILLQAVKAIADPAANMEVKPMPTVGVDRMDQTAVNLLTTWIMSVTPAP